MRLLMITINIIIDYKKRFETKFTAIPYRSGFNKELLRQAFIKQGIEVNYIPFSDINFRNPNLKGQFFLACASEDHSGFYKSYIEDIILGLEQAGANVIPGFLQLKSHHNKLFMEIQRDLLHEESIKKIYSLHFGTIEELVSYKGNISWPVVFKPASGSMSKGVSLAHNMKELKKAVIKVSRSPNIMNELKDKIRLLKYKGYIPESKYRKKYIIQTYIPNLTGDWKILVYGRKYYVLKRKNRENDFRASGGGRLSYERNLPEKMLDFAEKIINAFHVPNISLDIAYDGCEFYLLEFQFLYFGTYTIENSEFYFMKREQGWFQVEEKSILEEVYAESITNFIWDNYKKS